MVTKLTVTISSLGLRESLRSFRNLERPDNTRGEHPQFLGFSSRFVVNFVIIVINIHSRRSVLSLHLTEPLSRPTDCQHPSPLPWPEKHYSIGSVWVALTMRSVADICGALPRLLECGELPHPHGLIT